MSTKHTPGPWTYHENINGKDCIITQRARHGYHIARTSGEQLSATSIANATLIAAAPELLEYANILYAAILSGQITLASNADVLKLRKTIAKAEGRE